MHSLLPETELSLPSQGEDRKNAEMGFRGAAPVTQPADLKGAALFKKPHEYFEAGEINEVRLMWVLVRFVE